MDHLWTMHALLLGEHHLSQEECDPIPEYCLT